ncbi:MAG: hypothetical protein R3C99_23320 [Pirellulaceae bacterium]|nr:hypothetical protein [Planctomycetales bacterium]MCA9163625.1 hypothetical protein [Planctomycetales bacterium]MCA9201640.1 hypothetical protein [Planctomycetales bacterium]MCA9226796.1 hypothetical protein [Planctomycetales bacterium]
MATEYRRRFEYEPYADRSMAERCTATTTDAIRDFPMTSLLVAFGLGIGLGAVVGSMVLEQAEPVHHSRFERLGRRLMDAVADAMPEHVGQRLHS